MKKLILLGFVGILSIGTVEADWEYMYGVSYDETEMTRDALITDDANNFLAYNSKTRGGAYSFSLDASPKAGTASDCDKSNCTATVSVAGKAPYKTKISGSNGYYRFIGDQKQVFDMFANNKVVRVKVPMRVQGGSKTLVFTQKQRLNKDEFGERFFINPAY